MDSRPTSLGREGSTSTNPLSKSRGWVGGPIYLPFVVSVGQSTPSSQDPLLQVGSTRGCLGPTDPAFRVEGQINCQTPREAAPSNSRLVLVGKCPVCLCSQLTLNRTPGVLFVLSHLLFLDPRPELAMLLSPFGSAKFPLSFVP